MKNNKDNYVIICIEFKCNNNCISCMIKDTKKKLIPVSFAEYKKILNENLKSKKYNCLILSGAEVTTNKHLPNFVKYAKSLGNIKHIRIQTNGRKLSNLEYCKNLIDAGIDEFFISIYSPSKKVHESLTCEKNSFEQTLKGIKNINSLGKTIITNTVITKKNYRFLSHIIKRLSSLNKVKEMQFWNYCPMKETDEEDLIESNRRIKPYLTKAIEEGRKRGISIVVKYFPECLLGKHKEILDNSQPDLIIDEEHWQSLDNVNNFKCIHKESCLSNKCPGLPFAYIKKFGWDITPITGGC